MDTHPNPRAPAPALVEPPERPLAVGDTRSEEEREEMPLPRDPQTIFQGGLFLLACLAALYVARTIVLPIVLALMLKLLLQPLVRALERIRVPKALGALAAVVLLLGIFAGLGTLLTGPAASAVRKLPDAWPRLREQWGWVQEPLSAVQLAMEGWGLGDALPEGPGAILSKVNPSGIASSLASGAGGVVSHLLETLLILFYLLVFGETFLRRIVEILPRFQDKREAVELSMHLERDLSAYLVTVTAINAVVGMATGAIMWAFGVPGAALWGVLGFCLNYIPILGPFAGVAVFALVGLLTLGAGWFALLPAAAYLGVHVLEGEIITPMLLARRFTINPVAVMLGLVFWYWMWGVTGAVLAVPLLAMTKIICDRLRPFRAFGHLLEG